MTKYEKLVVSAYTGCPMVSMDELQDFVEETLGHPIPAHTLGWPSIWDELRKKLQPEFQKLCREES